MKKALYLLLLLPLFYCCSLQEKPKEIDFNNDSIVEIAPDGCNLLDETSEEYDAFIIILTDLYNHADKNSKRVILKADSLILEYSKNPENPENKLAEDKTQMLHDLKGEILYKNGKYKESIKELEIGSCCNEIQTACNYIKLKEYSKARSLLDSVTKAYYIWDFVDANYYEVVGKKDEALMIYQKIKNNKEIMHYAHYKLAIERISELEKSKPHLLKEIYYETQRPDFEIAKTD